ncbi:AraC family transcriptional regulator [Phreatobacter sp.]|uniref:AraC family transcriptional regulator n=1 Tax=Phreatobacter sp. TaxID=1966341 RepID=UPI003F6F842A
MSDSPESADPLAQVIALLKPRAVVSKGISGAGRWAVTYAAFGLPGFCVVLEGGRRLAVEGQVAVDLAAGDFVLLPATPAFTMSSFEPERPVQVDPRSAAMITEEVRHGRADGPPDLRLLGGHFAIDTPDPVLLGSLLPVMIHIRGNPRFSALVRLIREEEGSSHAGRELVLARLVEVLLIEALRVNLGSHASSGLMRGLGDPRICGALRQIHAQPQRPWTAGELAHLAGMSRSAFFDRFSRMVGIRPMEYLVAWRMALARDLLRRRTFSVDEVAHRVGYGSASTFSIAFSRHVGQPPGRYARATPA